MNNQHPLFIKYTREWLHQVTGYTKSYLSRVATGKMLLSRSFIERACFKLGLPEEELFLPNSPGGCGSGGCGSGGCATVDREQGNLGRWLRERCQRERLSLRQAAARSGLSHATLAKVIKSGHASPETIRKLAAGFGGDGTNQRLALEDHLLVLAGHRTPHQGEESSYLKIIPLLTPEHQQILEVLVTELAKIEGAKMPPPYGEPADRKQQGVEGEPVN